MKATEKQQIRTKLNKTLVQFLNKQCAGLSYRALIFIILDAAQAIIRMCVREGYKGGCKDSRKVTKLTRELFCNFAEMTKEEYSQAASHLVFEDDEEDEPENA